MDKFISKEFNPVQILANADMKISEGKAFEDLNALRSCGQKKLKAVPLEAEGVLGPDGFPIPRKPQLRKVNEGQMPFEDQGLPVVRTKQKRLRNVLQRMEEIEGPLASLRHCRDSNTRVKVYTRNHSNVRGILTGYVIAFDKYWNVVLRDVDEVFQKRVKCMTVSLGNVERYVNVGDLSIQCEEERSGGWKEKNCKWPDPFPTTTASRHPVTTSSTLPPTTASTLPPTTSTLPPTTSILPPTTASTLPPTTSILPPTTSILPPTTASTLPLTTASTLPPTTSTSSTQLGGDSRTLTTSSQLSSESGRRREKRGKEMKRAEGVRIHPRTLEGSATRRRDVATLQRRWEDFPEEGRPGRGSGRFEEGKNRRGRCGGGERWRREGGHEGGDQVDDERWRRDEGNDGGDNGDERWRREEDEGVAKKDDERWRRGDEKNDGGVEKQKVGWSERRNEDLVGELETEVAGSVGSNEKRKRRRKKYEIRERHVRQLLVRGESIVLINVLKL